MSIEFDFAQAKRQANQLDELSEELQNLANQKFGENMQSLSTHWKGQNADAYLRKGNVLKSDMEKTARDLQKVANNIRTVAKKVYHAEMEAKRIAETRTAKR